ncbi:MAG: hypothetical protein WBN89_14215 [Prochlorococcaceae cyanobacterium]
MRRQALSPARLLLPLLLAVVILPLALLAPGTAAAAEVLQVRSAALLQVGDSNRSYGVALACVAVEPEHAEAATHWLRERAPRGTRVNLRPVGQRDGVLLARVRTLADRSRPALDLGEALVALGLAQPLPGADLQACAPR